MEKLLNLFSSHPLIRNVLTEIYSHRKKIWISGLWGSSHSFFISALAMNYPVVVVVSGMEEVETIFEDLSNILKKDVRYYPIWEFSPEKFSPASELLSKRLSFFESIALKRMPNVLVIPAGALKENWPLEKIDRYFISLKCNTKVDLENLLFTLSEMGYRYEDMVSEKGEFSHRGEIIDIFPPTSVYPLRIVLEFDEISSIRFFSIENQRSVHEAEFIYIPPVREEYFKKDSQLVNLSVYLKNRYLFVYDEPSKFSEEIFYNGDIFLSCLEEVVPPLEGTIHHKIRTHSVDKFTGKLDDIIIEIRNWKRKGFNTYLICNNEGEEKRLREILGEYGIEPDAHIKTVISNLKAGFILPELKLSILTDQEIFDRYRHKEVRRFKAGIPLTGIFELNEGDYVVHVNHGIGRYLGLKHMKIGTEESDYLSIEYRDGAKLYVPIEGLDLIQKYVGIQGKPPVLSRLGGKGWTKTKERTTKFLKDMASELLKLHAQRQVFKGHTFKRDTGWQREFEGAFIYKETPDQKRAIQEVKNDMESPYPMDRLVLGDAGYGKTEVAMRAAFKAVMDNKQVVCLVPTTLLAYQHYNTFSERMADYPIIIKCLSRFESRSSQRDTIRQLAEGKVDIVIGTHRLLQKDVSFKDLGLVIIDEEQRFGVAHKEKIRKMYNLVDCITLSATPIPRTLYMGLAGLRDISLINTPPDERLPVETIVTSFDKNIIRQAILYELGRGGQTFVVHNRIDTIYLFSNMIKEIVPEARIAVAHGEMASRELEEIMIMFLNKEIDILIATTIIASGLDIPNANTIIVNDAHTFGLADLYQLRGRVGRFRHRAYALFIIPKFKRLTEDARKRLKAIEDFTELGTSFKLALRDLEIRGAGNLLGPEQHGFIAAIGFDLYCQLLQRAVAELKGEVIKEPHRVVFEVGVDFSLPPDYIPGVRQRLDIYRKMATLKGKDEIKSFEEELVDRFGRLPERARKVLEALEVKDMARRLGIIYVSFRGKRLILKFSPDCSPRLEDFNNLEEELRKRLIFGSDSTIFIKFKSDIKDTISAIRNILMSFQSIIQNSY